MEESPEVKVSNLCRVPADRIKARPSAAEPVVMLYLRALSIIATLMAHPVGPAARVCEAPRMSAVSLLSEAVLPNSLAAPVRQLRKFRAFLSSADGGKQAAHYDARAQRRIVIRILRNTRDATLGSSLPQDAQTTFVGREMRLEGCMRTSSTRGTTSSSHEPGKRPASLSVQSPAAKARQPTPDAPRPLRWAPPRLTSPITITVRSGLDPDHLVLSTKRDYRLILPPTGLDGTLEIDGGHNVVLIGGSLTVPASANQSDNGADDTDTGLYIRATTGTVHIEGISITGAPLTQFDGIDINAPQATVQLENVRISNVWGSFTSEHADAVQTWGGVKSLEIDGLSASGDYQGLTIQPDLGPVGHVQVENTDLTLVPPPASLTARTVGGGYMMWLTSGVNTCTAPTSVTLTNVYIYDESTLVAPGATAWPGDSGNVLPCAGVVQNGRLSWPKLPVSGAISLKAPPNGPFVPADAAGSWYVSPGYN